MKKILAIGNSFSQDATALIELLTDQLYVRNLYIGGCSLKQHCENLGKNAYEYQHNGERCENRSISLKEALLKEHWDYVTVQQVSGEAGREETYYPYLTQLLEYIKTHTEAQIIFHQTWAYETGSTHPDFAYYDCDQNKMAKDILYVTASICDRENLKIIRCGEMISRLRKHDFFNISKGGISLCRDSFHLSLNYGRFAASAVWIKFFTGEIPDYLNRDDLSEGYNIIKEELNL